jgi:hypothetical protein
VLNPAGAESVVAANEKGAVVKVSAESVVANVTSHAIGHE